MYDPQFMMSICVNGQSLLSMVSEELSDNGMKIIQVNTDGIIIYLNRADMPKLNDITERWMKLTGLKLEYEFIKKIAQRDVNSYWYITEKEKIKRKGAFDYNYEENNEYYKDFSMRVVAKALEAYYKDGVLPEDFIASHNDLYDFFLRTKYNKVTSLVEREYNEEGEILNERMLQNVTRYYVSNNGKTFIKIMPPLKDKTENREFAVESGYKCTEMNNMNEEKLEEMSKNLNYDFYIAKVREIVDKIKVWSDVT